MPITLLDRWTEENNDVVKKWNQQGHNYSGDHNQSRLKWCSSEFHKLLKKIQGVPAAADHSQLELTVVYNACVFLITQTRFPEAELLLMQGLKRVVEVIGGDQVTSDLPVLWQEILKSLEQSTLRSCILQLLCLQWAIWLSTCRLETIQDLQEELWVLSEGKDAAVEEERGCVAVVESPEIPHVVLDPRVLNEQLQICTVIAQGAERLNEGRYSEALSVLQKGVFPPAPRALLANMQLLSGLCLARMGRPQMALLCYTKALEMDTCSVLALHKSMLIYRHLGNTQAEIQALQLLYSTLMLPHATDPAPVGADLLPSSLLLRSQSLSSLLSVPSSLSILHSLALKCALHGRVSESVEHYLDLLAAYQSNDKHTVCTAAPLLPRSPELYLEAGTALLMARRPADCMTLCDEVISTTLELLPEKLILEEPLPESGCEPVSLSPDRLGSPQDRLDMFIWVGAAYLLQADCQTHLKNWKQAVAHYTRCINLLVKVHIIKKDFQPQISCLDMAGRQRSDTHTLQRLKGLSLAGRGIIFVQRDQLKEALRDLQLSLQMAPECVSAGLWLGEVLWRLGRRQEAAACWKRTWSCSTESLTVNHSLSLCLTPLTSDTE
ncbi:Fanconi anemia group G protein isoform X2 [Lampris incognitus]|uniref:Fanconi anemia group G protein isoform X2 n=1 Tax=Lampris incognitus TaxID=2546036 RepID=UPI0024B4F4C9|nr:Fanconi anemia group G protein isoform X2 [Lampris incognitus]